MLLVIVRIPAEPLPVAEIARATGLAPADVRHRLAGGAPAVLLTAGDAEVRQAVDALETLGVAALACSPDSAPTDADRLIARSVQWRPDGFVAVDAQGASHPCAVGAIRLIQKGVRVSVNEQSVTVSERKLSASRAILSAGLLLTKKVSKQHTQTDTARETFVLVQRDDGEPDVALYERRMDFRFLGAAMLHSSQANLAQVTERLRELAPAAPVDDRVARPGLVQRMPRAGQVDPVDLALHLVSLAHLRLARWNRP